MTKAIIRLVIGRAVLFHSLADHECYDALAAVKFFYYVSWEIDNETLDEIQKMASVIPKKSFSIKYVMEDFFGSCKNQRTIHGDNASIYAMYFILTAYCCLKINLYDDKLKRARMRLGLALLTGEVYYY